MHGQVRREAAVQIDDVGLDLGSLLVGERTVAGEIPGAGAVEEAQRQPGAYVDAVERVSIFVTELAGNEPADIAAPGGVFFVA